MAPPAPPSAHDARHAAIGTSAVVSEGGAPARTGGAPDARGPPSRALPRRRPVRHALAGVNDGPSDGRPGGVPDHDRRTDRRSWGILARRDSTQSPTGGSRSWWGSVISWSERCEPSQVRAHAPRALRVKARTWRRPDTAGSHQRAPGRFRDCGLSRDGDRRRRTASLEPGRWALSRSASRPVTRVRSRETCESVRPPALRSAGARVTGPGRTAREIHYPEIGIRTAPRKSRNAALKTCRARHAITSFWNSWFSSIDGPLTFSSSTPSSQWSICSNPASR